MSRTNAGQLGLVGLDEHVDAVDAGVAGRVDERLAERADAAPRRVVERPVADHDGLDADVVVGLDLDGHRLDGGEQGRRVAGSVAPYSHARSSRSCRRARLAIRRGSSLRWISTSVCSTESWRWAATAARSSSRMRTERSSSSDASRRPTAGAANIARPPTTTAMARPTRRRRQAAGAVGQRDDARSQQTTPATICTTASGPGAGPDHAERS